MMSQLTLRVQLRDDATFENFYIGENQALVESLLASFPRKRESTSITNVGMDSRLRGNDVASDNIYMWGFSGVGKTHLLQAACHLAQQKNLAAIYLSFKQIAELRPAILEDIESFTLVCFDDLEILENNPIWQETFFHCYNRLLQSGTQILIAATKPAKTLRFQLPDLVSRLCANLIFQLQPLNDEQKMLALQLRSNRRGINLPTTVAEFMLNHYSRNMHALFAALAKLDEISLVTKKKLTIPFVKDVLNN